MNGHLGCALHNAGETIHKYDNLEVLLKLGLA